MNDDNVAVDGGDDMYVLYKNGDLYSLSVLVSSGMYNDEIVFLLGDQEVASYKTGGKNYLIQLVRAVRRSPSTYKSRVKG